MVCKHKSRKKIRDQLKNIACRNKGINFILFSSLYVDDAVPILLNRTDACNAMKILHSHFKRFGLTIHTGSVKNKEKSKTEFMVIPGAGRTTSNTDTEDIFINEDLFISSCDRFKYLGSIYTPSMKNALDIENCISKAQQLFSSLNKLVFRNVDIDVQIRKRIYIAIITNILLWGCESWALTSEERRKMEVFHTRCCRRMLNITIYDVMANHELTNKYILHELNMLKLESYMELRRARWLEKFRIWKL